MRMSAPSITWKPAPNATPCTAAITGIGKVRQPQAAFWKLFAMPCVRGMRSRSAGSSPSSRARSMPAQNARPSPESTTQRTSRAARNRSSAAAMPSYIATSIAFILSGRARRTSATPASMAMVTRCSFMGRVLRSSG
jgi:uncharacterized MAPEG superfamily protein